MGIIVFLCWWFPIGLDGNARLSNEEHSRGTLAFLFVWTFMLLCSTFAHLMIAGITNSETACNIGNVFAAIMLLFCGIISGPKALPGFWIFAYRINPFNYLVEGLLGVGLAKIPITCSETELLQFEPAKNTSCGEYMSSFIAATGGTLFNPDATGACRYCALSTSDTFLSSISVSYDNRWRDWGLMWVFISFNVGMAIFLYWLMRVPKDWSRLTRLWKKR
jgi:ABC-type multidrug transport system permease subunit